jgi:hypothetical protein
VLGCSGQHAQWLCGAFGSIKAEEQAKIIEDNKLCSFGLLHDRAEACRTKVNKFKPAYNVPECGGQHAIWLHKLFKDTSVRRAKFTWSRGKLAGGPRRRPGWRMIGRKRRK